MVTGALYVALSFGVAAQTPSRDEAMLRQDADVSSYEIQLPGRSGALYRVKPNVDLRRWVLGSFGGLLDDTAGNTLYVFPNGKFAVTEWCDICPRKPPILAGEWTSENGVVVLRPTHASAESERLRTRFLLSLELDVYAVLVDGYAQTVLVSRQLLRDAAVPMDKYVMRTERYVEWQRIYDRVTRGNEH